MAPQTWMCLTSSLGSTNVFCGLEFSRLMVHQSCLLVILRHALPLVSVGYRFQLYWWDMCRRASRETNLFTMPRSLSSRTSFRWNPPPLVTEFESSILMAPSKRSKF